MSPSVQTIEARSKLYKLFALALHYPGADLVDMINEGLLAESFVQLFSIACPELPVNEDIPLLVKKVDDLDLGAEYNRLFEVGDTGHAPCSLYGGPYSQSDRHTVLEETIRFYNHFGLQVDQTDKEMPDQLSTELEFLHFLTYCQVAQLNNAGDSSAYARAEHDFLLRHPGKWVPIMYNKLERENPCLFYHALVRLLKNYLHYVVENTTFPASQIIAVTEQH